MASEFIGLNDPQTVKQYARDLFFEAREATYMNKFIGKGQNALVSQRDELSKGPGDEITLYLAALLEGDGVTGTNVLKGSEQASQTFTDKMKIDKQRQAVSVRSSSSIVQQRVSRDLRDTAKMQLKDWWARRMDLCWFNQMGGVTSETLPSRTGLNATIAPSVGRHFWSDVSVANDKISGASADETVGANPTDIMTVAGIRSLRNIATQTDENGNYRVRPIMLKGKPHWVMFLHNDQVKDLKNNTDSSGEWFDIHQSAMQGGDITQNPIFTGAIGMFDGVVLHESENVPQGVHSSTALPVPNTRRAIFAGAQACHIAFGMNNRDSTMDWAEELDDFGEILGIAAGCNWGIKKAQYNGQDYGTCVLTTYAARSA